MNKYLILSIIFISLLENASAASFDCKNTLTKIEKVICQDSELSKLDKALHNLYTSIRTKYPVYIAKNLTAHHRVWLQKRNNCKDADLDCLSVSYKSWIGILKEVSIADTTNLHFDGNDETIVIEKSQAVFTDPKGNSYVSWLMYPNNKISLINQLMDYPFSIGFSPYNTHDHPLQFTKNAHTVHIVSCNEYLKAKKEGYSLSIKEPSYRYVQNYFKSCYEMKRMIDESNSKSELPTK